MRADGPLFPSLDAPDERPALRVGESVLTYADLETRARAWAGAHAARGLHRGDRVAIRAEGSVEAAAALVAHAWLGLVTVPLNPRLGRRELAHVWNDAAPRGWIGAEPPEGLPDGAPRIVLDAAATSPLGVTPRVVDDDPLLVLYTSGTTGSPKGAILTARNVASNLDALARIWAWTGDDEIVHALPLFHVHGLVLGLYGPIRRGGTACWLPRFDPHALAARLSAPGERPRVLFGVPTMYGRLADAAEADPGVARALATPRLRVSGSAALPAREHRRLQAVTGGPVLERYGLTETLIDTGVPAGSAPRPGSVGPPLPGVELRLVDDAGGPLPEAQQRDGRTIGEVAVRGPHVFAGYLNRPEATRAVLDSGGWFRTGDLARRDADGWVWLVGRRATDLIKTGGYKVGAGEVEGALLEHPGVREAAVVGRADPDLGERIVAFVVTDPTVSVDGPALAEHVARALAPHKRPRAVHLVSALPRNALGKVQKARLPSDDG